MKRRLEKQKNIKEWKDISNHLKELKDEGVPSSQSIDYISSEEEKESPLKARRALWKSKEKNLHPSETNIRKRLYSDSLDPCPSSPVFKRKLDNVHSQNVSNNLPLKSRMYVSGNQKFQTVNTENLNSLVEIDSSSQEEIEVEPLFKLRAHNSPVVQPQNSSIIESSSQKSEHIHSPILKTQHSPVLGSKHSPVLKSKLKNERLRRVLSSRNTPVKKCKIKSDNETQSPDTHWIRDFEQDDDNYKVHLIHNSESSNSSDKNVNTNIIKWDESLYTKFIKEPSLYKLFPDDDKYNIDNSFSPSKNTEEEINSSTPSIISKNESTPNLLCDDASKRGSEWLKTIKALTPEKTTFDNGGNCSAKFDSTKKKIKKNGFADQLQKLVQSWQSNVSMWNHQISLALINQDLSCSLSPFPTSQNYVKEDLVPQNPNLKCAPYQNFQSSSSDILENDRDKSLPFHSPERILSLGENPFAVSKDRPYKSPLPTFIRNLRSFESSSESSIESSNKTKFTLPKKHLCVKVLEVHFQTSIMVMVICKELDKCSLKALNHGINEKRSKKIMIIFEVTKMKPDKHLQVGSIVTIFAPWQSLEIFSVPYPLLFSSYFVIRCIDCQSEDREITNKQHEEEVKLAEWECDCTRSNQISPSCEDGKLNVLLSNEFLEYFDQHSKRESSNDNHNLLFSTIKDTTHNPSPKGSRFWTVIEAIEQCGGMPDISVSLTLRIKRVFSIRTAIDSSVTHYLILGQDPDGTFALVEVPNRPLKSTLKPVLEEGMDTTRTLTHLSVKQRIVDTDDPELFSLINSLQTAYNESLKKNCELLPLLEEHLKKPPQAFCYKFIVNLGQTLEYKIPETNIISVSLPVWSLEEVSCMKESGKRGHISVVILYRLHPYLYVSCTEGKTSSGSSDSPSDLAYGIYKITLKNSIWLPPWVDCDGTIMVSVLIEDVVFWRGTLIVDKFSRFLESKEEVRIDRNNLMSIIPPMRFDSKEFDVVVVKGLVANVLEEKCHFWEECNICGGHALCHITPQNIRCQTCGTEHISPITKHSLEVEVGDLPDFQAKKKSEVRVSLFQATIKRLLKNTPSINNKYDAERIKGTNLEPMICCLKSVEEERRVKVFTAIELPY